jgi:hypothetical protein
VTQRVRHALETGPCAGMPAEIDARGVPPAGDLFPGIAEVATLIVGLTMFALLLSVVGTLYRVDGTIGVAALVAAAVAATATGVTLAPFHFRQTATWLAIAAAFLAVPVLSSFVPPYSWDEVAYSVALPKLYAAAHRIFYAKDTGTYSAFPASYEALTTASLLLTGSITPMRLLGVACLAVMGGITVILSRILTGRTAAGLLAGALVIGAGVGVFSSYVKNDFVNGAFQAAAILFVCAYLRCPGATMAALAGMAIGISGGTKYNSLQFAVCAIVCALPFASRVAPKALRWKHLGSFGLAGVLAGTFWYARNTVLFGNPIYPFSNALFGGSSEHSRLFSAVVGEMFYGYTGFSFASPPASAFLDVVAQQFGIVVLVGAAAGSIDALVRLLHRNAEQAAIGFFVSITVVYSLVCFFFGLWAPRYFVVLVVCYAVLAAGVFSRILNWVEGPTQHRRPIAMGVAAMAGLALLGTTLQRQWRESAWLVNGTLAGVDDRTFVTQTVNYWNVANWINTNLPACAKVGVGIGVQPFFYIDRAAYNFTPLSEDFLDVKTADAYGGTFQALGLTHLAVQDWLGTAVYVEARNPNMYRFINNLYASIHQMEASGSARLVGEIAGLSGKTVKFYDLQRNPSDDRRNCPELGAAPSE